MCIKASYIDHSPVNIIGFLTKYNFEYAICVFKAGELRLIPFDRLTIVDTSFLPSHAHKYCYDQ